MYLVNCMLHSLHRSALDPAVDAVGDLEFTRSVLMRELGVIMPWLTVNGRRPLAAL